MFVNDDMLLDQAGEVGPSKKATKPSRKTAMKKAASKKVPKTAAASKPCKPTPMKAAAAKTPPKKAAASEPHTYPHEGRRR
jgi:hypothetical protein